MNRLFELRTEKQLSQRAIAKIINVSQGTYNNWENERTQPSIEQLIVLSKLFCVSIDYIVCNTDDCGLIKVDNQLNKHEKDLLEVYNKMDTSTKANLVSFLNSISLNNKKF